MLIVVFLVLLSLGTFAWQKYRRSKVNPADQGFYFEFKNRIFIQQTFKPARGQNMQETFQTLTAKSHMEWAAMDLIIYRR